MKRGKKYQDAVKSFDKANQYDVAEAISLVKKNATAKFDETIELHIKTGCDGRHAEQQIRGAVVLPHGTGKTVKVLVFAKGVKLDEAQAAGADYVGGEELVPKIQNEGWLDFDVIVATPDMMGVVGRLGRVLGPKGLMPNPKAGTVTMDVTKAINDIKAGKIEYRLDKTNIIHVPVGKASVTMSLNTRSLTPIFAANSRAEIALLFPVGSMFLKSSMPFSYSLIASRYFWIFPTFHKTLRPTCTLACAAVPISTAVFLPDESIACRPLVSTIFLSSNVPICFVAFIILPLSCLYLFSCCFT